MRKKQTAVLPANREGLSAGLDFIESELKRNRFRSNHIYKALLLSEESMIRLIEHGNGEGSFHLSVRCSRGLAKIVISAPGSVVQAETETVDLQAEDGDMSRSSEAAIRQMLLHANQDRLQYVRKGKYNFVKITAGSPEQVFLCRVGVCFLAAIILGLALNALLPPSWKSALDAFLLSPVRTIFLNALKLTAAPTVFFSILSSVARFSAFTDPGKVSLKVWLGYLATSLAAIAAGAAVFLAIRPGQMGELVSFVGQAVMPSAGGHESIRETVVNIIPSNIVEPFLKPDTLQLIFLALLFGVALGRIGDYSSTIYRLSEAMENLFSKAADILNNVTPCAAFFCTLALMLSIGPHSLLLLAQLVGTVLAAVVLLLLFYGLILLLNGLNPILFLKKYARCMGETFLLGSGVAALPKTLRCCKKALGVSSKVCSFSLPFGAIANMDGNCLYLTITGLFLARLCGVELFSRNVVPLVFIVLILSVGAPIASGTVLMCMMALLNQMNVSLAALTLILGINALIERFLSMTNTLGDVTITLAVAKSEKLLDTGLYRNPNLK